MTKPDYKFRDPKGRCGDPKRGAAMGRGAWTGHDPGYEGPICIKKINLDSGGYDSNGTYFGRPPDGYQLYWTASPDHEIDYMTTAQGRATVEAEARKLWPKAKIQRTPFNAGRLYRTERQLVTAGGGAATT